MTAPLAVNDQAISITASCYDDRRDEDQGFRR
jgi:hypothetical protein